MFVYFTYMEIIGMNFISHINHCGIEKKCSFKGEITLKLNLENFHMIVEYGKQSRFIHKHIQN